MKVWQEKLKQMYIKGLITKEELNNFVQKGLITEEEKQELIEYFEKVDKVKQD